MERTFGWAKIDGNILSSTDRVAYGTLSSLSSTDIYYGNVEVVLTNPLGGVAGVRYKVVNFSIFNHNTINEIDTNYNTDKNEIIGLNSSLAGSLYFTKPFVVNESCVIRYAAGNATALTETLIIIIDKNIKTTKIVSITAEYKGVSIEMGETWNPEDLVVTGVYPNGTTTRVNAGEYIADPINIYTVGSNLINITLNDVDNGAIINQWKTTVTVPGIKKLVRITAAYDGPQIAIGKSPLRKNILVTAYYSDNTSSLVTDWAYEQDISVITVDNKGVLAIVYKNTQRTTVTIPYYESVSNQLTAYYNGPNVEVGSSFLPAYLTVKIHYSTKDGANDIWEDLPQGSYVIDSNKVTYEGNNIFTVSYEVSGKTMSTTFAVYGIRPEKKLLFIEAEYNGPNIIVGKSISTDKIICRGHYSDNTLSSIKDFTISKLVISQVGSNQLTLTYKGATCILLVTGVAKEDTTENNISEVKLDLNYPEMTLVNHRYRGPLESYKLDLTNQNVHENIKNLYSILNSAEEQYKTLCKKIQLNKTNGAVSLNSCRKIEDAISYWESKM